MLVQNIDKIILQALTQTTAQLSRYEDRPEQIKMSQFIGRYLDYAKEPGHVALIEAGTGVGKSYGYLVPICQWLTDHIAEQPKALIATNTLNLQEQLIRKDIPVIKQRYPHINFVKAKGRNNYVCLFKLREAENSLFTQAGMETQKIVDWLGSPIGTSGERSDIPFEVDQTYWKTIASDPSDCLGVSCPFAGKCYFNHARYQLNKADVIVTTQAMILTDLKQGNQLLPKCDLIVLDEAHNFEKNAINAFTTIVNSRRLKSLINLSNTKYCQLGFKQGRVGNKVDEWRKNARIYIEDYILSLEEKRFLKAENNPAFEGLHQHLKTMIPLIDKSIEKCQLNIAKSALSNLLIEIKSAAADLEMWTLQTEPDYVYWVEKGEAKFVPVDISPLLQSLWNSTNAILTSATLSVNKKFDLMVNNLGLHPKTAYPLRLDSPFNHKENAVVYTPPKAPSPKSDKYVEYISKIVKAMLTKTKGKTFVLFTSFLTMQQVYGNLQNDIGEKFTWLIQGEDTRERLLEKYRTNQNAVLFGTDSFWEGVDEEIDCVIITKLPFRVPTTPVEEARHERIKARGMNPFMVQSLPQCALRLKQGTGRLIRHSGKRGIIVMCDPRINSHWGKIIKNSLPDMKWTDDIRQVDKYLPSTH